jgi:hypothetical protein
MNLNHVLKKVGRGSSGDLFSIWYFRYLHALGYLKSVTITFKMIFPRSVVFPKMYLFYPRVYEVFRRVYILLCCCCWGGMEPLITLIKLGTISANSWSIWLDMIWQNIRHDETCSDRACRKLSWKDKAVLLVQNCKTAKKTVLKRQGRLVSFDCAF